MKHIFKCQTCHKSLSTKLTCSTCKLKIETEDNILKFEQRDEVYMDTTDEILDKILEKISSVYWKKAVYDEVYSNDIFLYEIMTASSRADGQFLMPLKKGMIVADIGSGYGTFSIPLAKRGLSVIAIDSSPKRLRFLYECAKQENVQNHITPVLASAQSIPLKNKSVDAAIMNGVLEWVGAFSSDISVEQSQKKSLKETHRILKQNGCFYLGIENREGLKYMLGANEDHSGIPFISLLPRKKANTLSESIRGKPYNTYTYNKKEYISLLKLSGFNKIEIYSALPDYKIPTVFFPNNKAIEKMLSNMPEFVLSTDRNDEWHTTQKLLEKQLYLEFSNSFIFISYK